MLLPYLGAPVSANTGCINKYRNWRHKTKQNKQTKQTLDYSHHRHTKEKVSSLLSIGNDPSDATFESIPGSHSLPEFWEQPATLLEFLSLFEIFTPSLQFWKQEKDTECKVWWKEECGTGVVLLLAKNCQVWRAAWAGTLSRWRICLILPSVRSLSSHILS